MAEKGNEVGERPPPGQPADEEVPGEIETLEEVSSGGNETFKTNSNKFHCCTDILTRKSCGTLLKE